MAASTLGAGAKALASRTEKGHYDPQAGRAPSPINMEVEELREANRRLLEELQKARREIEERNRTSPPPSPVITRARVKKEEKMEEDESGEELGGIFPSLVPSPDIPRPSREELEANPANRPPIQGKSKRLEDPKYPAITSNKVLQGDESVTIMGQVLMGQMREEWRREMREMRELIEMRLPPLSLPNLTPSESPSGSGPPPVKAVAPPTGNSRKEEGKKGKKKVPKQRSAALQQPTVGPPPPPKEKKKDPSKKPGPPTPPGEVKNTTVASTAVPSREAESWTTVVKKGKKKLPPSKGEGSKSAPKSSPTPPSQETGKKGGKKKRRAPRTAAIMLTCPGGEYAATMRHVQERIPLKELGITGPLKPNTAQTGAMLIELSGPDKGEKADRLASKMADLFADRPEIRITRPQKMGEIRINGKDPSITPDDIARAVVEQGGCSLTDIKVGDIREMGRGQRTAWVRCPLETATKVAQVGHLKIRWFTHKVELLSARPLQCYKCLEKGHVQAKCPSGSVDRSKCCYRCGTEGHEARTCTAPAHCTLCHAAGRPANHRMMGPACKAPKNGGKKKKGVAAQAPPPQKEGKKKEQAAANLPALEGPCPPEAMECEPTTSQCPAAEDTRMVCLQE
ncbi:neurofilament heavy polypeptide-like [Linepithema humile]|uniref:neurofilament heavy polypeptide-like n=1 Tax=Linepithema humile TaxID=83485 RepID=UPI00351F12CD